MKGNNKIKRIASTIVFIILFQYVSIIIPFLEVHAASMSVKDSNGVTWRIDCNSTDKTASIIGVSRIYR